MSRVYQPRKNRGFGNRRADAAGRANERNKPLKRPLQGRAKFTVQAIYDAFVRIWRTEGWAGITTRAVALDTGISVGTLYDYFPNKHALLSGYMRHAIETLVTRIEREVVEVTDLDWQARVRRLVRLSCGVGADLPPVDREMLMLTDEIAEPKHHRRVFEELSAVWWKALSACKDLPDRPHRGAVVSLFASVWGARRYLMLVEPKQFDWEGWVSEMERMCCSRVGGVS